MDAFTGKILPEDPLPAHLTDHQLHLLNSHTSARLIWGGEGNSAAPLFIVLDNPGGPGKQRRASPSCAAPGKRC